MAPNEITDEELSKAWDNDEDDEVSSSEPDPSDDSSSDAGAEQEEHSKTGGAPSAPSGESPNKSEQENPDEAGEPKPGETESDPNKPDSSQQSQTAAEMAEKHAKEKADRDRQAEIDRIVEERRKNESQSDAGGGTSESPDTVLASLVESSGDVQITDPENTETGKTPLSDWVKKYPNIAELAVAISQAQIQKHIAPIQTSLQSVQGGMAAEKLLSSLASDHGVTNASELVGTDEYWDYVDKQSPGIRALADSPDPNDVAVVMRMYNESIDSSSGKTGKKSDAADEARAQKETEHKRQTDLHTSTLRSGASAGGQEKPLNQQMKEAWEADDDDED